ncbi:hypothetical protein F4859DRAFT_530101 [Xylaria cf. heliscus]|nr:hypothetical protein F4859DRAFT_530101 [Xylaria cf. heliscus]
MGVEEDFAPVFKTLVNDLKILGRLPFGDFCNRIHNKTRYNYAARGLFKYIDASPNYPPDSSEDDWHEQVLDESLRAQSWLSYLTVFNVAEAIDHVGTGMDPHGYKYWILQDHVKVRYGEVMTKLMGLCLAEHINAHLESLNHPTLRDLSELKGVSDTGETIAFYQYMRDRMEDDDFIDREIMVDQNNKDHIFSISLLFAVDYLAFEPGHFPAYDDDFTNSPSYEILQHWSNNMWSRHAQDDNQKTDDLVEFCGKISTIGYTPATEYKLAQPTPAFTVLKAFYGHVTNSSQRRNNVMSEDYINAVSSSVDRLEAKEEVINEWKTDCEEMVDNFRALQSDKWHQAVYAAFSAGDWNGVGEWASSAHMYDDSYTTAPYYTCFNGNPPYVNANETRPRRSFVADTQIQFLDGTTCPVQELKPGDHILSSVSPTKSVRVGAIIQTRQDEVLVGFNGNSPFTTTSQVFMTPTGLRAVDPRQANALNPFNRVHQLAVGHSIYRIQGDSYQVVEIKSIEYTERRTQTWYTVVPRGDGQFHHANGYLTAFNDPIQSRNSAAALLRNVPASKRIPFLAGLPAVRQLLRQHGTQTIQDKLNKELSGLHGTTPIATTVDRIRLTQPERGVPLELVQNGYQTYMSDSNPLPDGYQLPSLDVIDGCLIVDGHVQLNMATDRLSRAFRWTRHLPQLSLWEHGFLKIYPHGAGGTGATYLTANPNPASTTTDGHLCRFLARAINPVQAETPRLSNWGSFTSTSTYQMTFDREVWPAEQPNWDTVKDKVVGGEIVIGFAETEEGYQVPTARVPILDDLLDQINQKYGKSLDPLYRVAYSKSAAGNSQYTVQFHRAALIPFLADQGLEGGVFELAFKSQLGLDLTLPCLFREIQVEMDLLFPEDSRAVAFEYDPGKREMKGNRHFVSISEAASYTAHFERIRAKVSRAFASQLTPRNFNPNAYISAQPADITRQLEQERAPSVSDLIDFHNYDDQSAHDASQKLIHKMMLYHMNADDRDKFLKAGKPDDLPYDLADGLDADFKDFIRNKYAVAFLCNSFGDSHTYANRFTSNEQKKLWYWWQGNGRSCLSRSKEYNQISNLTSVQGMKDLHQSFLTPYLNSNPEDWANQMLSVLQKEAVMDLHVANPIQDKVNVVNQQSCVMHTLAPDQPFADKWFQKIVTYTIKRGAEYPTISSVRDEARQYLTESIRSLVAEVIESSGKLPNSISSELRGDVEQFENDSGLDQDQSADTRAQQIVDTSFDLIDELSGWVSSEDKGLDKAWGGSSLYQWISEAWDQISEKYQASKILKGIFTTGMASYKLFRLGYSLVGLIQNWNDMSGSDRATVIMEMLQTTTEGLEYAYDAWKVWKGRTGTVILDHLDATEMDQGIYRSLDEKAADLATMSDEVNPEGGFHESVGEHVGGEGVPTSQEGEGASRWNEPIEEMPEKVPPGEAEAAEEFSLGSTALKVLTTALGLGIAIAMTFSLVHDWDSLSLPDKIINTLALVVQVLTVALDVIDLGSELGFWAVGATLSAALPVVGVVLVVVGVILAIVSLLIHLFSHEDPPEDPVQTYIDNTGKPLIAGLDDAPDTQLAYSVSPSEPSSGDVVSISIEAQNNTGEEVALASVTITVLSGGTESCLFSDKTKLELVDDDDPNNTDAGHIFVTPNQYVDGYLPLRTALEETSSTYYQYDLQVGGPKKENVCVLQPLILGAFERFSAVFTATVNSKGYSKIDVVEKKGTDRSHARFMLTRV